MILVESIHINNSGGLTLLQYLVECLEKTKKNVFYVFDKRAEDAFSHISSHKCLFIEGSLINRFNFYQKNRYLFNTILCFGNLPPPIKTSAKVYVYFQQRLFLEIPDSCSKKNKLIYFTKQQIIRLTKNNADIWLIQSKLMQDKLADIYHINKQKTNIAPFYPPLTLSRDKRVSRIKNRFIYVSNVTPHKNHERLIKAFCLAYDQTKKGELLLTIPSHAKALLDLVKQKKVQGYPIDNIGFIDRDELVDYYLSAEYLIFPSLIESFGLGLAEGIDLGCKVIGPDLPYTYEVCYPSLVFDPCNVDSIKVSIIKATTESITVSEKIIDNDISLLLDMLKE